MGIFLPSEPMYTILDPSKYLWPIQHPVFGEYGRLDSLWRVRSHLETSGQPKAGTVTITLPQSQWAAAHQMISCGTKMGLHRKCCLAQLEGRSVCVFNARQWGKERHLVNLGPKPVSAIPKEMESVKDKNSLSKCSKLLPWWHNMKWSCSFSTAYMNIAKMFLKYRKQ